jgi:hypothetical protein
MMLATSCDACTAVRYALVTAGLGLTVLTLAHGVGNMEGQHWIMLVIILAVGYVVGRIWATPAQLVGLP